MLRPSMRGGVPVFRRSAATGSSRSCCASVLAGGSPARPPAYCAWPMWILPARKVPAVSTTVRAPNVQPHLGDHAGDAAVLDDQVVHRLLEQLEVRLGLDHAADRRLVQRAVGLAARGAHGRALRRIQRAPLDAGTVGGVRHRAAERVDLLDQVALADAADGRVAAHLADRLDVVAEQQRARTGARSGQRGLGAGVAAADHDDVVVGRVAHQTDLSVQKVTKQGVMVTPSTPCGPIRDKWHASCLKTAALSRADAARPRAPRSDGQGFDRVPGKEARRHPSGCRRLLRGRKSPQAPKDEAPRLSQAAGPSCC